MKLPEQIRKQFQKHGRTGGLARAARLSASDRSAIARRAALRRWNEVRFGNPSFAALGLPGGEMVDTGLDDLVAGRESVESFAVSLAAPRLRRERVPLPKSVFPDADMRLYRLLEVTSGGLAHARYLACLRQMNSFADACRNSLNSVPNRADELTRERLQELMRELARTAPRAGAYRVYLVGGGSAVYAGWRRSSIDADLFSDQEEVFHDIQAIKERLRVNVEFARPEHFVPPLEGSANRHIHLETIGPVSFFHYDPYAQVFSKIVRGFERDLQDARAFLKNGLVEGGRLRTLVETIPEETYAKYPNLTPAAVLEAVDGFLSGVE